MHDPLSRSRYMGETKAQIPLRLTKEMIDSAIYYIDNVAANSGYQAQAQHKAAKRWNYAVEKDEYVWLGISGAATPVGLGGLIADMIDMGAIDAIVSTGANVYHDLHFAFGLPVRHGSHMVDDNDLRRDETTRIYTQFIHNRYTLRAQDLINQELVRKVIPRLKFPFSTARFLYEFGKEIHKDDRAVDKKGSFVIRAADFGVPIFLDSGSNHSLGMDLALLHLEGLHSDTSPSRDLLEATALSMYTQPQLNVFLGEGGPRNFIQTTAPTASEVFAIPFKGSEGCIRFTVADERAGALSGSSESEAVSWGKYVGADPKRDIVVWGEYTTTAPQVMAYVAKNNPKPHRRLMEKMDGIMDKFLEEIESHSKDRKVLQDRLRADLPFVVENEIEARKKVGYKF